MLKKLFTIKRFVIVFFIALVLGSIFLEINDLKERQNAIEQTSKVLLQENDKFRLFSLELCQNTSSLSDYLFLDLDCQFLFGDGIIHVDEINIEAMFLDLLDVFVIKKDRNEALAEEMFKISTDKKVITVEDYLESEVLENALLEILKNDEIQKYSLGHGLVIATTSENIIEINRGDKLVARIYQEKWKDYLTLEITSFPPGEVSDKIKRAALIRKEKIIFNSFGKLLDIAKENIDEVKIFDITAFKEEVKNLKNDNKNQNILILGRSGENIDTIMMASLNHADKKITLISIPRDLFYESRKINSYYHFFGIDTFVEKISKISGQSISNYVMVDMMVFPEIVDALGGVEFEFESDLIDPYYKTIDDGVESTLYYPKGQVHLNGIEALRVARSRYTTSDFSRAARQQKLMKSVNTRLHEMKISNILFKYIPLTMEKVDTDLSLYRITSLFLKIKDFDIQIGSVISSGNILDSKMYNLQNGKKMFILEPKGKDWDLIKQYIGREINKK